MKTSNFFIIVLAVLLIMVAFFLLVPHVSEINTLNHELDKKQQYHDQLQTETTEVKKQIDQLHRNDPAAIEAIARDKFGYCREGEDVYQLETPAKEPAK